MEDCFEKKLQIPFTKVATADDKKILKKFSEIIRSGDFILGKDVKRFEEDFAAYIGAKYCIGVASGTDAILLTLIALGITQGDEVIVPAFTFVATVTPLMMIGARPVYVDIKPDLPIIDEGKLEKAITKKTKAILVVHLYGFPCEMFTIQKIARKYHLFVIEDASQAHGTSLENKRIGSLSDVSAFSFYPTKNLGAFGDAGAILTSSARIYKRLLLLRNHGQMKKYDYATVGYNSRLDSLQAAVLQIKLKKLEKEIKQKIKIISWYESYLIDLPVKLFSWEKTRIFLALHVFVIRTTKRDKLQAYLQSKGISCLIHYPKALPDETILTSGEKINDTTNSKLFGETVLSLPFFPSMKKEEVRYVCKHIRDFFTRYNK